MTQRTIEAEKEIRAETGQAPAADLLGAARLLDRAAESVDSDAGRLRLGRLMRIITDGLARRGASCPRASARELRLRAVRAAIFAGDPDAARRAELQARAAIDPVDYDLDGLRDLADALLRLDAPGAGRRGRAAPRPPAQAGSTVLARIALRPRPGPPSRRQARRRPRRSSTPPPSSTPISAAARSRRDSNG